MNTLNRMQRAQGLGLELRLAAWNAALNGIAGSHAMPRPLRALIYRAFGIRTASWRIGPRCFVGSPQISVGRGSFINCDCFLDAAAAIRIGNGVHLAQQVAIFTSDHQGGSPQCRAGALGARPVTIEDGCWIGARATILPGITIGRGCVIAAAAVVTRDCEPCGLYVGVPARRAKDLDP